MVTTTIPHIEGETESRLEEYRRLIHDACFRACTSDHHGLDMDDMVQEANLKVWKALQKHPDANKTFIWKVAQYAAIATLRRNRRSVDRPLGGTGYEVVSLERLVESTQDSDDGLDSIQDALARRHRRGEVIDPTQDIAVANIMREELEPYLVPRERQAFILLLREYQAKEIAGELGISQAYAQRLVMGIRIKAARLWELQSALAGRIDPSLATRRCYERKRDKYNANRRAKGKKTSHD